MFFSVLLIDRITEGMTVDKNGGNSFTFNFEMHKSKHDVRQDGCLFETTLLQIVDVLKKTGNYGFLIQSIKASQFDFSDNVIKNGYSFSVFCFKSRQFFDQNCNLGALVHVHTAGKRFRTILDKLEWQKYANLRLEHGFRTDYVSYSQVFITCK